MYIIYIYTYTTLYIIHCIGSMYIHSDVTMKQQLQRRSTANVRCFLFHGELSIIWVVVSTSFPFYLGQCLPPMDQNESNTNPGFHLVDILYWKDDVWTNDPQYSRNSFRKPDVFPGLSQALAFTNHSCLPNCRVEFASGFAGDTIHGMVPPAR